MNLDEFIIIKWIDYKSETEEIIHPSDIYGWTKKRVGINDKGEPHYSYHPRIKHYKDIIGDSITGEENFKKWVEYKRQKDANL